MDRTPVGTVTRSFGSDQDFRRIRALLVETYPITPVGFNWDVRRWDGWRFYRDDPAWDPRWRDRVRLWETTAGRLVGAVHPEATGDTHLQVHPDWRHLDEEMIAWAEENLAGREEVRSCVFEDDALRAGLLVRRGWERTSPGGVVRRLRFGSEPHPAPPVAAGYRLRTTRPGTGDAQRLADLLNAAFRRDFHTAAEYEVFAAHAPSFRREADLVAEAPDGSFAAYVGAPYDEANRRGMLEPVCTHPDHQRRGLARTLALDALVRLRELGAAEVTVGAEDSAAANRFYESLGLTEARRESIWRFRCGSGP